MPQNKSPATHAGIVTSGVYLCLTASATADKRRTCCGARSVTPGRCCDSVTGEIVCDSVLATLWLGHLVVSIIIFPDLPILICAGILTALHITAAALAGALRCRTQRVIAGTHGQYCIEQQ
jgi:hypothetical protein